MAVEPVRAVVEGVRAVTNGWVPNGLVDVLSVASDTSMIAGIGLGI